MPSVIAVNTARATSSDVPSRAPRSPAKMSPPPRPPTSARPTTTRRDLRALDDGGGRVLIHVGLEVGSTPVLVGYQGPRAEIDAIAPLTAEMACAVLGACGARWARGAATARRSLRFAQRRCVGSVDSGESPVTAAAIPLWGRRKVRQLRVVHVHSRGVVPGRQGCS